MRQYDRSRVAPSEWELPREHLEKHDPQRVDICAGVYLADGTDLLGRHIVGRPEYHPGPSRLAGASEDLGDPEVGQNGVYPLVFTRARQLDYHVRGLDIAMDQALRVGVVERSGDIACQHPSLLQRQCSMLTQGLRQIGSGDV